MTGTKRDWDPFALLLIDVQKDFWTDGIAQHFPDFPANVARLLSLCRAEGLEIIHLRALYKPDMSDWMAIYKLRGRIPCVEGTEGAETLPFALEKPGETVIIKHTFDGLQNAKLSSYLQRRGKRFLLTAGLITSVCVFLTTASAAQNGFLTAIVKDCCADDPVSHEQTLERYGFIFDQATVDLIPELHAEWTAWLAELKELDTSRSAES